MKQRIYNTNCSLFTWTGNWATCCVPDSVAIYRQKVELHTEAKRDDPRLMMQIMLPSRCGWLDPSPVDETKTFSKTSDVTEWIRCVSKGKCRCYFLRKSNNRRTNSLQFNWSPSPWEIFPADDGRFRMIVQGRQQISEPNSNTKRKKWITKISTSRFPWNRRQPHASIGQEKWCPDFCCSPVCWHADGSAHHNSYFKSHSSLLSTPKNSTLLLKSSLFACEFYLNQHTAVRT